MEKVKKKYQMPAASICGEKFGEIDYWDCYQITRESDISVDNATTEIFKSPKWVDLLMKIRNVIVKFFGLRSEDRQTDGVIGHYEIGSKESFFPVLDRNEKEIVFGEDDRHLNFRASVMVERIENKTNIYLMTIVKFHNIWGRIYFIPVKPFHKLIVRSTLRRCK